MDGSAASDSSRRRFLRHLIGGATAAGLGGAAAATYQKLQPAAAPSDAAPAPIDAHAPLQGRSVGLNLASPVPPTDPGLLTHLAGPAITLGMDRPRALALGPDGRLHVAGDRIVRTFDPTAVTPSAAASSAPILAAPLLPDLRLDAQPTCIALDARGRIYVGLPDRIARFEPDHRPLDPWPLDARLAAPLLTSLAVGPAGLAAADAAQRRVHRFDPDGRPLPPLGDARSPDGGAWFNVPSPYFDLAMADDGLLWVANPGRHRVEAYTPQGDLQSAWGEYGPQHDRFCGCCNPSFMTLWPSPRLGGYGFLTSEKGIPRVKLHDRTGCFLGVVAGPEAFTPSSRGLDLVGDAAGRVFVLDAHARSVRCYEPGPRLALLAGLASEPRA